MFLFQASMCDNLVFFSIYSHCKLIILVVLDCSLWFSMCSMGLWEYYFASMFYITLDL